MYDLTSGQSWITHVGEFEGDAEGDSVGETEGDPVGVREGVIDGESVGSTEGDHEGNTEGDHEGDLVGVADGDAEGEALGRGVGCANAQSRARRREGKESLEKWQQQCSSISTRLATADSQKTVSRET